MIKKFSWPDARTALLRAGVPMDTILKFKPWYLQHPEFEAAFDSEVGRRIASGEIRIGAKAVVEALRSKPLPKRGAWKINNNYPAYYARLFVAKHPFSQRFFEFRMVRGLKEAA